MMKRTFLIPILAVLLVSSLAVSGTSPTTLEKTQAVEKPSVQNPVQPSQSLVSQASQHAASMRNDVPAHANGMFASRLGTSSERADKVSNRWSKLVMHRSVAVQSRAAKARMAARNGELTAADIRKQASQQRARLDRLKKQTSYQCGSVNQCVVVLGEVETSLSSAQSWLDQIPAILNRTQFNESKRLAYAAGALEAASGNLDDAESLRATYRTDLNGQPVESELDTQYQSLHDTVRQRIASSSYGNDVYANELVRKAEGRLDRAEERYENGLKAAALRDLLVAYQFLEATDEGETIQSPELGQSNVTDEELLTAKRDAVDALNASLDGASELERVLLKEALVQINGGDEKVSWIQEAPDAQARQQAFAHYVVAQSFVESADDATELASSE